MGYTSDCVQLNLNFSIEHNGKNAVTMHLAVKNNVLIYAIEGHCTEFFCVAREQRKDLCVFYSN